jgi:hypothetical protein
MTCKFVWLVKGLLTLSTYDSDRGTRVARMFGANPGQILVLKCIMRDSPFAVVTSLFIGGISFFGYVIQIAESPIRRLTPEMDYTSYINACWGTVATMTTVGYGDIYPRTTFGRGIMIFCSMYGVIVVSLMVVTVTNFLCMSQMESASYTVMKKLEYKELIRGEAVKILVNVNRDPKGDPKKEEERYCKIKNAISSFRYFKRIYRNIGELNLIDEMTTMFNKVLGVAEDIRDILQVGDIEGEVKSEMKSRMEQCKTDFGESEAPIREKKRKSQIVLHDGYLAQVHRRVRQSIISKFSESSDHASMDHNRLSLGHKKKWGKVGKSSRFHRNDTDIGTGNMSEPVKPPLGLMNHTRNIKVLPPVDKIPSHPNIIHEGMESQEKFSREAEKGSETDNQNHNKDTGEHHETNPFGNQYQNSQNVRNQNSNNNNKNYYYITEPSKKKNKNKRKILKNNINMTAKERPTHS